jgi:hypothetical protein
MPTADPPGFSALFRCAGFALLSYLAIRSAFIPCKSRYIRFCQRAYSQKNYIYGWCREFLRFFASSDELSEEAPFEYD